MKEGVNIVKKMIYLLIMAAVFFTLFACGQTTTEEEQESRAGDTEQYEEQRQQDEADTIEEEATNDVEMLDSVSLYYTDPQLENLHEIKLEQSVPKNEEGLKTVLQQLNVQPNDDELVIILQEDVNIQAVEIKEDVVIVSFSQEDIDKVNIGSTGELLFVKQLLMTVNQFGYEQVQVYVDQEPVAEIFGHIDYSVPLDYNEYIKNNE